MTTANDVLKMIKDNDVKYVDFRFTDPRGKWQHVTFDVSMIEEDTFAEGQMFDGSSIAGWKAINESDMCLMPDPTTACIDPFFAETTMVLTCDVLEPTTGEPYNRDPRSIARKAEALVKAWGIGDTVYVGPEAEFFVFDDVKFSADPYKTGFKLDSSELPINSDTDYEGGNLGHRALEAAARRLVDHLVAEGAQQQQVLAVVAADQHQPALAVERQHLDDAQPALAPRRRGHAAEADAAHHPGHQHDQRDDEGEGENELDVLVEAHGSGQLCRDGVAGGSGGGSPGVAAVPRP